MRWGCSRTLRMLVGYHQKHAAEEKHPLSLGKIPKFKKITILFYFQRSASLGYQVEKCNIWLVLFGNTITSLISK